MKRALADPNICPALSVKQGSKCRISATGDWREARAPGATIYRTDILFRRHSQGWPLARARRQSQHWIGAFDAARGLTPWWRSV